MKRSGYINIFQTHLGLWDDHVDEKAMLQVLRKIVARLRSRGWAVQRDVRIAKDFPSLERSHYEGRKGDLQVKARQSGRHVEVTFFQDLVRENLHGGYYDFDKLDRMSRVSRALRIACIAEMWVLARLGVELGYEIHTRDGFGRRKFEPSLQVVRDLAEERLGRETPLANFNWHWGHDRFERDASGWPSEKELSSCWPRVDRDGKRFGQGDVKCMRVRGRIVRGQVFGGINGNWTLCSNGQVLGRSCGRDFFDCEVPDIEPRRVFPDREARLHKLLDAAVKAKDYARVAELGRVLDRIPRGVLGTLEARLAASAEAS